MDFSTPPTMTGVPQDIKAERSDSEDEDMTGGVSLITLGGMSSGLAVWGTTPTTFSQIPNHQRPRSEAQNSYFAGLSEERLAALKMSEGADERNTGVVRGKRRSRASKRDRGKMVNGQSSGVKMEVDGERRGGESRRRRKGLAEERRHERRAAAKILSLNKETQAYKLEKERRQEANRLHSQQEKQERVARELAIAARNGSTEGLSNSAKARMFKLKEDQMGMMTALADSMSLGSTPPVEQHSGSYVTREGSWEVKKEVQENRVAQQTGMITPQYHSEVSSNHFLNDGQFSDPGPFTNASNSPWYLNEATALKTNDQMADPSVNNDPHQHFGNRTSLDTPATNHEKSIHLSERGIKKAARIADRLKRAKQVIGDETKDLSNWEAKIVLHRERVGNELRIAVNGTGIHHLGRNVQERIMKIQQEYIPANPNAALPDFDETTTKIIEDSRVEMNERREESRLKRESRNAGPNRAGRRRMERAPRREKGWPDQSEDMQQ